ncbi:MAG: DUF1549 and DUF1553 domain-containing protein [Verrucomicrobiales bacterium]|nr:DUF1549 and DUF1553 domain-containing protein [Verrucomicrobiales bacterium]
MKASHLLPFLLLTSSLGADAPISFKRDVMPVFMKHGCNAGDCHGSSRGQDGFVLSLFGYDAEGDFYRLTEEIPGRRINLAASAQSLLLTKATGQVAHTGGELFTAESESYELLLRWLEAGAPSDPEDTALATGIRFSTSIHKFDKPGGSLQAKVIATYSDGSERDVTRWSLFMTNDESVAAIDDSGLIQTSKAGGANVFARFDKFTVGMEITVLPEGEFDWPTPPVNNFIDELTFAKLEDLRIVPSGLCTDEEFLRRVTIDLTGTLPTPGEYRGFMSSDDPDKRTHLVDELLGRESFGEMMAAKWGEWLRIYADTNPEKGTAMKAGWNYYHWVREQMVENTPLSEFAYALLTGNGSNLTNPPSNYYTMIPQGKVDPIRLSEDTAQIFLGIRTQCAQCHNHPFDRWTIDDYYSFQSFFTGVRRKHGSEAREYFTFVDVDAEPAKHIVDGRPMPHKFLGGDYADVENKDPRKVLAAWMTSPENQLFRQNVANRIWSHFFGRGIIEEVDDIRISNPPGNAPLLSELGRRFAEDYGYDQKKLIRDICLSRTYQLSATTNDSNRDDERFFSHAALRRMRADVLFDCLTSALDYQHKFRRSTAERAVAMFEGGRKDDFNAYFFKTFGQARRESVCACEDQTEANLSQALHLINGKTIDDALQRNPQLIPYLMDQYEDDAAVIEALFIRALSRKPTETELHGILALMDETTDRKVRHQNFNNVLWGLLNSSEFLFNH